MAAQLGLRRFDRLISLNGNPVMGMDANGVQDIVRNLGRPLQMVVARESELLKRDAVPGVAPTMGVDHDPSNASESASPVNNLRPSYSRIAGIFDEDGTTFYKIVTSDSEGVKWESEHRFNDFKELQDTLHGHVSIELPRKHLFRSRFESVINERRAALGRVVNDLARNHIHLPVISTFLKQTKRRDTSLAPVEDEPDGHEAPQISKIKDTLQIKGDGLLQKWTEKLVMLDTEAATLAISELKGPDQAPYQVINLGLEGIMVTFEKVSHEIIISENDVAIVRLKTSRPRVTDDWFKKIRVCAHASALRNSSGKLTTLRNSSLFVSSFNSNSSFLNDSLSSMPGEAYDHEAS